MRRILLAAALLIGTAVSVNSDTTATCAREVGNVTCCCRTLGGGLCCAEAGFCGGFVPGCICR